MKSKNKNSQIDYYFQNHDKLILFTLFVTLILFFTSICAFALSLIAYDNAKDTNKTYIANNTNNEISEFNNITVDDFVWVEYNFTVSFQYEKSFNCNMKFISDNSTIVNFCLSQCNFNCFNYSMTNTSEIISNNTIPDYLIPNNGTSETSTGRFYLQTYLGGDEYLGYLVINDNGNIEIGVNTINNTTLWNTSAFFCIIETLNASYLLNPLPSTS
jgi:hypothetical protein